MSPRTPRHRGVAAALALSLALMPAAGAVAQDDVRDRFTVTERALTDAVVDLGAEGDSLGDLLVFGNDLYDSGNEVLVGRDQGTCVRTNPGLSWECTWSNLFEDGSIVVQGPFYDDLRDSVLAVTGGTGRFAEAEGTMTLGALDAGGTLLAFAFDLTGPASDAATDSGPDGTTDAEGTHEDDAADDLDGVDDPDH